MARPRKDATEATQAAPETKTLKPKGQDAVISLELSTSEGTERRQYRIKGFMGNTLGWQRSAKGLDDIIIPGLQKAFGGQVVVE